MRSFAIHKENMMRYLELSYFVGKFFVWTKILKFWLFNLDAAIFFECLLGFADPEIENTYVYRTPAIITRGLYTVYPIFEGQKRFSKELFS